MDPRFLYLKKKKSNVALSTIIHKQLQTPSNITLPTKSHRQPCPFTRSSRISTRPTFLNPQNSLTSPPLLPRSPSSPYTPLSLLNMWNGRFSLFLFWKARGAAGPRVNAQRREESVDFPVNKNCPRHARPSVSYRHADPSSAADLFPRDGALPVGGARARPTPIMLFLSCIKENSRARDSRNLFAPVRGKHHEGKAAGFSRDRGRST